MQRSAFSRSRRELSNEYLLGQIGVDTAENEPLEVWWIIRIYVNNTEYYSILFIRVLTWDAREDRRLRAVNGRLAICSVSQPRTEPSKSHRRKYCRLIYTRNEGSSPPSWATRKSRHIAKIQMISMNREQRSIIKMQGCFNRSCTDECTSSVVSAPSLLWATSRS